MAKNFVSEKIFAAKFQIFKAMKFSTVNIKFCKAVEL